MESLVDGTFSCPSSDGSVLAPRGCNVLTCRNHSPVSLLWMCVSFQLLFINIFICLLEMLHQNSNSIHFKIEDEMESGRAVITPAPVSYVTTSYN